MNNGNLIWIKKQILTLYVNFNHNSQSVDKVVCADYVDNFLNKEIWNSQ